MLIALALKGILTDLHGPTNEQPTNQQREQSTKCLFAFSDLKVAYRSSFPASRLTRPVTAIRKQLLSEVHFMISVPLVRKRSSVTLDTVEKS
jgi:hypothetical protein